MDTRPIGIFDSGVGGLTVYTEMQKNFPNENYIYLADTKNFPYGNKSKEEIINITKTNIEILLSNNVKAIIIACGTATSQALDVVRNLYNIPIIGIIEPTSLYLSEKNSIKNIGIIATCGSIRSNLWANSILKVNSNLNIINKACPELASIAEQGKYNDSIAKEKLHEYLKEMRNIDALILGCTHYPLFINLLKEELPKNVKIINPGILVAKYIKNNFEQSFFNFKNTLNNKFKILITKENINFRNVSKIILNDSNLNIKITSL